jgi:ABC-type glycerol-3-phosphate transport system permease component
MLFSLWLMPSVGLVRTTLALGAMDATAALGIAALAEPGRAKRWGAVAAGVVLAILVASIAFARMVEARWEGAL